MPREADLCCYWFEKARAQIERRKCTRAGLLATQGIRGGANVKVIQRIKQSGDMFFAIGDRDWILEGANVHVSLVGFDDGREKVKTLNGQLANVISPQLAAGASLVSAKPLSENLGISFMGITPAGEFDIDFSTGATMLSVSSPNGRPNSDVIRPYFNGKDLNQRPRHQWTIDFGVEGSLEWAGAYELPFEHLVRTVEPVRAKNNRETYRRRWWLYAESRPAMRSAFAAHDRYIATCMVAKHRIFTWLPTVCLPANVVIVFARSDDLIFGILHSRIHQVWAFSRGTQLREKESGDRYTPTTCFETFPLPECVWAGEGGTSLSLGEGRGSPDSHALRSSGTCHPTSQAEAIAAAAKELDELRNRWLNPPEWTRTEVLEFPGSADGPWARYIDPSTVQGSPHPSPLPAGEGTDCGSPHPSPLPKGEGTNCGRPRPSPLSSLPSIGTVRWPRLVPKDADCAASLKKRTLTNLYNERPTWLAQVHRKLDEAVFAAYGWLPEISDEELLEKLLALNLERAAKQE